MVSRDLGYARTFYVFLAGLLKSLAQSRQKVKESLACTRTKASGFLRGQVPVFAIGSCVWVPLLRFHFDEFAGVNKPPPGLA